MLTYSYSKKEMLSEFNTIKKKKASFDINCTTNKIVLTFQPHFYEEENKLWEKEDIKKELIANRKKYLFKDNINDKELLRGFRISGIHRGFSHHSPFWIKAFIDRTGVSSIYDPCGGWGQRLLGAWGIKYIYNDADKRTVDGVKDIANFLDLKDKTFYNEDSSDFKPTEGYEAVFTCPPYFNLEKYGGDKTSTIRYSSYKDWINVWWRKTVNNCIHPDLKLFAFIMKNKYKDDMKKVCEECGMMFIEEFPVGRLNNVDHFNRKRNILTNHREFLIILGKGSELNYPEIVNKPDTVVEKKVRVKPLITNKEINRFWELKKKMEEAGLL